MNDTMVRHKKNRRTQRRHSLEGIERLEARIAPATFRVTSLADSGAGSLRAAIDLSNSTAGSDVILFTASLLGAIKLHADLPGITDSVSIIGSGAGNVQIDGGGHFQIFNVNGTHMDVTISHLKMTGGFAQSGGAIQINDPQGTVTIDRCVLSGNLATGSAGTADVPAGGNGAGAAITLEVGNLTVTNSIISGNKARGGKGFYLYGVNENGAKYLQSAGAGGDADGGAIFTLANTQLTISGSTISGNGAVGGRGGVFGVSTGGGIESNGALNITRSAVTGNVATSLASAYGGGIVSSGTANVKACVISSNTAIGNEAFGGGISNAANANFTLENSTVSGNTAVGLAGASGHSGAAGLRGADGSKGASGIPGDGGGNGYNGDGGDNGVAGGNGGSASGGGTQAMPAAAESLAESARASLWTDARFRGMSRKAALPDSVAWEEKRARAGAAERSASATAPATQMASIQRQRPASAVKTA